MFLAAHMDGTLIVYDKERDDAAFVPEESSPLATLSKGLDKDHRPLLVNKSVNSRNQKSNPVASWKISNHRINDFAFSPDSRHLAVVTEDGFLQVIDYLNEQWVSSSLTASSLWLTLTDLRTSTPAIMEPFSVSVGRLMASTF